MDEILWKEKERELSEMNSDHRIGWILRNIKGDSVADIGGAWGGQFYHYRNAGHKGPFTLIEANSTLIEEGKKIDYSKDLYDVIQMECGTMSEADTWRPIPRPDNSYDTVIMGDVLEHNHCVQAMYMLADGIRIAKQRVLITTPNGNWISRQPQCVMAGHMSYYTPEIFMSILDGVDTIDYWFNKFHKEWRNANIFWDRNKIDYSIEQNTCYILLRIDKHG